MGYVAGAFAFGIIAGLGRLMIARMRQPETPVASLSPQPVVEAPKLPASIAGGETSGAVTKALDVSRLDIGREIAPGVPWTFCHSAGHQIALTLKSGNFGQEAFFTDAQKVLDTV